MTPRQKAWAVVVGGALAIASIVIPVIVAYGVLALVFVMALLFTLACVVAMILFLVDAIERMFMEEQSEDQAGEW